MDQDIQEVLYSQEYLAGVVKELGRRISEDYRGKNLLMVSILKGSVVFMADLMRAVTIPCSIDFMSVSSYGSGTKTSGVVKIIKDLDINLEGIVSRYEAGDDNIDLTNELQRLKVRDE